MRKWIAIAGLLVLAFAAWGQSQVSHAETPTAPQRTIEVSGRGTITAKPDTAVVTLGISRLSDTPSAAFKEASKTMNEIAKALTSMGVKEDELKTSELNLGAEYEWTQEKGQTLRGYRATSNVTVTTQKLDDVPAIIEAAVAAGANQMSSLSFTVKDPEALLEQAMDLAADDAKAKAERVAKRMGSGVAQVLKITVMDDTGIVRAPMAAYETKAAADGAMPIFAGTTKYTVTISASFELK